MGTGEFDMVLRCSTGHSMHCVWGLHNAEAPVAILHSHFLFWDSLEKGHPSALQPIEVYPAEAIASTLCYNCAKF